MQEDHVSMGWSAARKLRTAVGNLTKVIAIEYLTAARALDLRAPLEPAPITKKAVDLLRKTAGGPGPDRFLAPDMAAAEVVVASGELAKIIN
jgi:histidine ammonia-lyase